MATGLDARLFSNIASTTAAFTLKGGIYTIAAVATFSAGSVELQALGPDQSTWLSVPAAFPAGAALKLSAAGVVQGYLPPGQYRFTIVTATAVFCSVAGVPES
jgi:hypothetical protein